MNILFVNYGDFTTNSLNHIGAFAGRLTLLGHACAVAVPGNPGSISALHEPLFTPLTFDRALEPDPIFPDRRGADVIHAWTPRENVREFTLRYLRTHPGAALLIHLEDNEDFLVESYARESLEKLRQLSDEELAARLSPRLSHPVRFRNFLRVAHGATYIADRLREFIPAAKPAHRLLPGLEPSFLSSPDPDPALREKLGLGPEEKILVYTGSTNFATLADIRTLVLAVRLINDRGTPCRLVRTGIHPPELLAEISALGGDRIIDLGFIAKPQLRPLLALADALVQPGAPDDFNDYRLPSKVPEFLGAGRPVILPRANLAREMEDGRHALLLDNATPEEIADRCLRVFGDAALARRLSAGARDFARKHFDLAANTDSLLAFYERVRAAAAPIFADPATPPSEDVLLADRDSVSRVRAKELTISHLREVVARRDTELAARQTEQATTVARANYYHAKAQEARRQVESIRHEHSTVLSSLKSLTRDLAAAHGRIDAANFRADAANARADAANARADSADIRADAADVRADSANARADAASARAETIRVQAEADRAAAAAEIQNRADKVARMQRSFSWQVTAPLRAFRRWFVDRPTPTPPPVQEPPPPVAELPAAPPPVAEPSSAPPPLTPQEIGPAPETGPTSETEPMLMGSIDEPADWEEISPTGTIRGWVLTPDGAPVAAIRLQAGGKTFDAKLGFSRPDVAAAHPANPHAFFSGFAIDYSLPTDSTHVFTFEALADGGEWRSFAQPDVSISSDDPVRLRGHYAEWVRRFDTLSPDQAVNLAARIDALPPLRQPRISILLPAYNTPEAWLVRAIESVRAQIYPHWELCVADDASSALHVRRVLEDFARRDERIKLVFRDENGHISAASNSALALATGKFTALLDHDDELPPHALAEVVLALAAHPELEFIYSDEDKIDESGRRFDPYFKPDWNPDLLLGQNYTCHLSVFSTARLRAIGGFREGYEGSQDWDLTLRATTGLDPALIHHIPRVLYHWRAVPGSTALVIDQKNNYPFLAAKKALADHLARTGTAAKLESVAGLHWRVRRALPSPPPRVSILIPTRNGEGLLRLCIGSILAKTTYPDYEIVVVDNGSDDPGVLAYLGELRALGARIVASELPFNYSALNNLAARHATGSVLAFLNNDLEVITPGWLEEMVAQALRPEIGCVGAMLYYPDETIQHAGAILGLTGPAGKDGVAGHAFKGFPRGHEGQRNRAKLVQNYSAVTAACLVVRREIFEAVGGFNEREFAVAFNDIDFCLRVRAAGHRNLWTPFAEFYHRESASRGPEDTAEKLDRFQSEIACMRAQWGPLLDRDPAYNPNLSLRHEDFSLAFPPR